MAGMINHRSPIYMYVIAYPCPNPDGSLVNLSKTDERLCCKCIQSKSSLCDNPTKLDYVRFEIV